MNIPSFSFCFGRIKPVLQAKIAVIRVDEETLEISGRIDIAIMDEQASTIPMKSVWPYLSIALTVTLQYLEELQSQYIVNNIVYWLSFFLWFTRIESWIKFKSSWYLKEELSNDGDKTEVMNQSRMKTWNFLLIESSIVLNALNLVFFRSESFHLVASFMQKVTLLLEHLTWPKYLSRITFQNKLHSRTAVLFITWI